MMRMTQLLVAGGLLMGLAVSAPSAQAQTFTLTPSNTTVTGANFIAGDTRIQFNALGETTISMLPSTIGQQYTISLTGQNDNSASFFNFFIDPDGSGPAGFTQLGGNFNFGPGFTTLTLPSFTNLGSTDSFKIVVGGTNNNGEGQIQTSITLRAVPGPVAGTGVLALLGLAAAWLVRRRRHRAAAWIQPCHALARPAPAVAGFLPS